MAMHKKRKTCEKDWCAPCAINKANLINSSSLKKHILFVSTTEFSKINTHN